MAGNSTTAGALKAFIEGLGLSISAYRDHLPPKNPRPPYVVIHDDMSMATDDRSDGGVGVTVREVVQVSLWQFRRDPTTEAVAESPTLPRQLARALHGALLDSAPTRVYGVVVRDVVRVVDADENLVHHAMTVEVHQQL